MVAIRSLFFNLIFYAVFIGMMLVGLPLLFAGPRSVKRYAQVWARFSLWLLSTMCGIRVDIRGAEALPAGGVIIASKHQSFLDIIVLLTIAPRFVFVLKRELMLIPLFGQFLKRAGMIPIDRTRGRAVMSDLAQRVRDSLAADQQLIIFPEGTRRRPGAQPVYKSGVSHLYAAGQSPCVPVALNTGVFWPRRSFLRKPGHLIVEALPAIAPGQERTAFLKELEDRIEGASWRLLREAEGASTRIEPAIVLSE